MIRGLYTSSAGMQVEELRQETIANNLANLNTAGFKRDMAIVEARGGMKLWRTNNPTTANPLGPTQNVAIGTLGTGVEVQRFAKVFEQGSLRQTDNPLDVALQGDGFFTVQAANGEHLYTRAGNFTLDQQGYLVDNDGQQVLGEHGPIHLGSGKVNITGDGTIQVDGRTVDRLALARFDNPDGTLEKLGDTLFRFHGTGQPPVSTALVKQGALEQANVNSVHEMVEMIAAMREYEANSKALQAHDQALGHAVNDVAK